MSFAPEVFTHVPELRGRLTPPEQSNVRLSYARFAEIDARAEAEGWAPGWRMSHQDRDANRMRILDGRFSHDLWVFAYGSLIWDPGVHIAEIRRARLPGWSRKFCMRIETGRGTRETPGFMAALDTGGHCDGTVFRIPVASLPPETDFLWRREMFGGGYCPRFLAVETPQGRVADALTFVINPDADRYAPGIAIEHVAASISVAEGDLGPNFTYLDNLVCNLDRLGIDDAHMHDLHRRCCRLRQGAPATTAPLAAMRPATNF